MLVQVEMQREATDVDAAGTLLSFLQHAVEFQLTIIKTFFNVTNSSVKVSHVLLYADVRRRTRQS